MAYRDPTDSQKRFLCEGPIANLGVELFPCRVGKAVIPVEIRDIAASKRLTLGGTTKLSCTYDRFLLGIYYANLVCSDVMGEHAELDVSVYDRANQTNQEVSLGHVRLCPRLVEEDAPVDCWLRLEPREGQEASQVMGEIRLRIHFQRSERKHYGPEDFQILSTLR